MGSIVSIIRRIIGAPDYNRYLELHGASGEAIAPMTREAFMRDALARRYEKPGSRCC